MAVLGNLELIFKIFYSTPGSYTRKRTPISPERGTWRREDETGNYYQGCAGSNRKDEESDTGASYPGLMSHCKDDASTAETASKAFHVVLETIRR